MNDGRKKKPQKHQNKTAFKIQFDTLALNIQKKVSLTLLCKRCSEQISWKLQFNKYKKITEPSKCNFCHQKNVVRSYMKCCDPCAEKEAVCPKCLGRDLEAPEGEAKLSVREQAKKDKEEEKAMNDYVDSLKERSRRKVRREYDKGIITWDNEHKFFRDMEGNQLVGLKFKGKGLNDLDKDMDDDGDGEDFDDQDHSDDGQTEQKILELKTKGKKKKEKSEHSDPSEGEQEQFNQSEEGSKNSAKSQELNPDSQNKEGSTHKQRQSDDNRKYSAQDELLEGKELPDIDEQ